MQRFGKPVVLPSDNSNECYKTGDKFEVQESYDYQIKSSIKSC